MLNENNKMINIHCIKPHFTKKYNSIIQFETKYRVTCIGNTSVQAQNVFRKPSDKKKTQYKC